jgi:electron transfer flavoprotein beta subunit
MKILVLLKMVPDVVEELEVGPDGTSLDLEFQRLIVSESDDHALEQALILKDRHGGTVTALALDQPDIDDVLFTALAKGVDRAVKVTETDTALTSRSTGTVIAQTLPAVPDLLPVDLIVTGCQAIDDLDGQVAPLVANALGLPYLGLVTGVAAEPDADRATITKEYAGGVRGVFEVPLPALLGLQVAEKPPRYVPVAKVRAAMKSAQIAAVPAAGEPVATRIDVLDMAKPESASHAEMLEGSPEEMAAKLGELLAARGLV